MKLRLVSKSLQDTIDLGEKLGRKLAGGEVIELVSDLGGGKTQLVHGLAKGMGSSDQVQSPSFTISRIYSSKKLTLHHFDFHRLKEPGIIKRELAETIGTNDIVIAIEWADSVQDVLPADRLVITITPTGENIRSVDLIASGRKHQKILENF